ncbi:MAG: PRC-barrel domain-containing protein [Ruminiclostridium sp.]|nr:PRC-barrel domain-containing protein [Ruminiclostridium sp.]
MLYWSESAGATVYIEDKKVGHIEDIMLEPDKKTITGFLLEKRNQDIRPRYFSFLQIKVIERNFVYLKDLTCVKTLTKEIRKRVIFSEGIINNPVKDEKGKIIGRVADIAFDPGNGVIKEIIISESFFEDIWFGRKKMPVLGHVEFSRELISVDKDTREEITVLNKGLKNWLEINKNK